MPEKATLEIDQKKLDLPVREGSMGADVVDISSLQKTDLFTYDPGFMVTAACESKITYIDGERGILLHRGYSIEELAEKSDHLEVCYLLLHGELPKNEEKKKFAQDVKYHTMVHEHLLHFFRGFHSDAHPMAMLCSAVGALAAFYHDKLDIKNAAHRRESALRLIAKVPTLAAMSYKHSIGQPFMYPDNTKAYAENFLHMMFGTPCEEYTVSPTIARAMDRVLLLHADHEQNASTSTVRMAGSCGANPFACIAAGVAALWGPAHGGANEAVLRMLYEIGEEKNIDRFIARAKDKSDPFRLMGFGHRVYKNYDPRARVMKQSCDETLNELGLIDDPLFRIARRLEQIALEDEYFVNKKLFPNVDFYSGVLLKALGIPTSMFTVIFAMERVPGWVAQWNEMLAGDYRIGRPRQLYTGHKLREFLPLDRRS